nr:MAG TPA: hypothetical protein [Caudoviricetes sp.]
MLKLCCLRSFRSAEVLTTLGLSSSNGLRYMSRNISPPYNGLPSLKCLFILRKAIVLDFEQIAAFSQNNVSSFLKQNRRWHISRRSRKLSQNIKHVLCGFKIVTNRSKLIRGVLESVIKHSNILSKNKKSIDSAKQNLSTSSYLEFITAITYACANLRASLSSSRAILLYSFALAS